MRIKSYSIILKSEPEGGYTVMVPSLPGCVTYGKTVEEAQAMAKDAIEIYISSLETHNETVPSEESVLLTSVNVDIKSSFSHA
jgi:predicted RNase H-like HicB family nuclease